MYEHLLEKHASAYQSCLISNEALIVVSKFFDYLLYAKQLPTKYLTALHLYTMPEKIINCHNLLVINLLLVITINT